MPCRASTASWRCSNRCGNSSDGIRAILYFDARADAGLTRGWVMIAIGGALALLFGFAMVLYYDRRGLHRLTARPAAPASPRSPES